MPNPYLLISHPNSQDITRFIGRIQWSGMSADKDRVKGRAGQGILIESWKPRANAYPFEASESGSSNPGEVWPV